MLIRKSASQERHSRVPSGLAVFLMACLLVVAADQPAFSASIRGTAGPDNLRGTLGDDDVRAFGGADTVRALDGNDHITGGDGDDTIYMGPGRAIHGIIPEGAAGGPGHDTIYGQGGQDSIGAGLGNDVLRGGPQHDELAGDDGNDTLLGGTERDFLAGDRGNDQIWGGRGRDVLTPANLESNEPGRDRVFMGTDNDEVRIGEPDGQVDYIDCGRGTDRVVFDFELDPRDVYVDCELFDDGTT